MKNKKVIIGILALALVLTGLVYTGCSEKTEEKEATKTEQKKEEKKTSKKAKNEPVSEEKADNDKKVDEGKKDTVQAKTESKKESASASKQAPTNVSKPASKPSAPKPSTPAPAKKKVWVVDKPAWTETVQEPIYAYRDTWWCKYRDGRRAVFYDEAEAYNEYLTGNVASWGTGEQEQYISGYNTRTIQHPEEGHWEEQ